MIGSGGANRQLFEDVISLIEQWIPERAYRSERKFRDDLQEYLDEQLNQSQGLMGQQSSRVVSVEHGNVNSDVCVDGEVGIELKRELTNSQVKKFRGQLDAYQDEYPFVIGCACGVKDIDGWRELENRFGGGSGVSLGMGSQQSEVTLIWKEKENFGSRRDRRDSGGGGLFGGDSGGIL